MRSVYEQRVADASEIERRIRQGTEEIVSRNFGRVAKLLWPVKTAAAYEISGEREPSARSIAAIIVEITRRT